MLRNLVIAFGSVAFCLLKLAAPSFANSPSLGWATLGDGVGTLVDYPSALFRFREPAGGALSRTLKTQDGTAQLQVVAFRNDRHETPADFLNRKITKNRQLLTYQRITNDFFATSTSYNGWILYWRCNFSKDQMI